MLAFEERIDPVVNAHVVHAAAAIREAACDGVRDVVGSYTAVTVHFDPLRTDVDSLAARMEGIAEQVPSAPDGPEAPSRTVEIPVCYGGAHGPDLPAVARFGGCSEATVVARHAAPCVPRLHAGVPAGVRLPRVRRPDDRGAAAGDTTPAGSRRVGRNRGRTDGRLSAGGPGRLAAHRANAPSGLRPGSGGAVPAAGRRRRPVRADRRGRLPRAGGARARRPPDERRRAARRGGSDREPHGAGRSTRSGPGSGRARDSVGGTADDGAGRRALRAPAPRGAGRRPHGRRLPSGSPTRPSGTRRRRRSR